MKMQRTNYFYPARLLDRLRVLSRRTDVPVVAHIRRAITDYLKKHKA